MEALLLRVLIRFSWSHSRCNIVHFDVKSQLDDPLDPNLPRPALQSAQMAINHMKLKERMRTLKKENCDLKMALNSARRHGNKSSQPPLNSTAVNTNKRNAKAATNNMGPVNQRVVKVSKDLEEELPDEDEEWLPDSDGESPTTVKKATRRRKTKVR